MDVPLLAAGGTFIAIVLASAAALFYADSREAAQAWRRRVANAGSAGEPHAAIGGLGAALRGLVYTLGDRLSRISRMFSVEDVPAIHRRLASAGYRSGKVPVMFSGVKAVLAVAAVCAAAMLPSKALGYPSVPQLLGLYVLAAACGYGFPVLWLRRAIALRKAALQRAMPDALDLMVVCVEAGLGLDQAIGRVGEEIRRTYPELSEELSLLAAELRTGASRRDALRNLARRTDLDEVRSLVSLLVQTDRFGTSVGQALRVYADSMRMARRLKAEELAAKLPVKLLLPLIFFIFPSIFIVLIGPAYIKMIRVLFPAMAGQ